MPAVDGQTPPESNPSDIAPMYDKAFGCLIGLAIGDSLGDQARSPENHTLYGITRDLHATVSWSTDDTEFALLVAHELIKTKGALTTEAVVAAWREYVLTQDDLGAKGGESEKGAAANLRRGIMPPYSGSDNAYHYSDGAAMRVAPIGIVCAGDPDRAARLAGIEASVSHYRDGVWGAQAVAASVTVAMTDASVDGIIATGRRYIPNDSWLGRWFDRAMQVVDDADGNLWKAWDPLHKELWATYRAANPEAVSEAYALFRLTQGDFQEGVIAAANFGRDADTLAALVGAWSGARTRSLARPAKNARRQCDECPTRRGYRVPIPATTPDDTQATWDVILTVSKKPHVRRLADFSLSEHPFDGAIPRAPPPILVDAQYHACALASFDHHARFGEIRRERFLAQDVQAARGSKQRLFAMKLRRAGNVHEIEGEIGVEERGGIGENLGDAELFGACVRVLKVRIGNRDDNNVGNVLPRAQVIFRDAARADERAA